jgi:hypothetical protein
MNARITKRITKWLCLWTAGCCLVGMAHAYAAINVVTPAEGTVGSEFIIYGSNFGDKRGKVDLGEESCKVLFWSNTKITCEVKKAQPAGEYAITVTPQGSKKKSEPMVSDAPYLYVMRTPHIDEGEPLRLVEPLEVVTITGDYFGKKKGLVGLRDTSGLTLEAKVLDWSPDAITFRIPEGLTGTCILGVLNDVGLGIQRYWCTFTELPPSPLRATNPDFIKETHENATGVFFNNEFWLFSAEKDLSDDTRNEILVWKYNYNDGTRSSAKSPEGQTDAQLAPIVIDHELYLFHTGESGQLFWKKYTVVGTDETTGEPIYGWQDDWQRIWNTGTEANKELAPVWNPIKNRIELFYYSGSSIYRVYSDDKGLTWSKTAQVAGLGTVSSAPSATFFRKTEDTGVVLLAFAGHTTPDIYDPDNIYTNVFAVQDGVKQGTQPLWWSPYRSSQPFIGHLGEDYIGVVFENGPLDQIDVAKMDKKTEAWNYDPLVPYLNQDVERSPSFAVNMEEHEDESAPLGVRYDAVAYLFWGDKRGLIGTGAYMSSVEILGYWAEESQTDILDTADDDEQATMFDLWQVIGIVDAPPYVLNGGEYYQSCDELSCTCAIFSITQQDANTFGYDISTGVFMETGEKSPVKMELSATVAEKYESKKETTVKIENKLYRSHAGNVLIFYLAPTFEVHHMQWYDLTGTPTQNFIHKVNIVETAVKTMAFDPRGFPYSELHGMPDTYFGPEFPIHASADETDVGDCARLKTYDKDPDPGDEVWFDGYQTWTPFDDASLQWKEKTEVDSTTSFDVTYKLGVGFGDYFTVGTMGSFGVHVTSTKTTTLSSTLSMVAGPENGKPFRSFEVYAYWLKPKPDAYWVPQNRLDDGDRPWFVSYEVHTIEPSGTCQ